MIENTGNVTIMGLEVIDDLEGLDDLVGDDGFDPGSAGTGLAPRASVTATATYKVTAADVATGSV